MADPDDRVIEELLRLHVLRRRIYRRLLLAFGAGLVGIASYMVRHAVDAEELGAPSPAAALLACSAFGLATTDAHDVRRVTARIQRLSKVLASLR